MKQIRTHFLCLLLLTLALPTLCKAQGAARLTLPYKIEIPADSEFEYYLSAIGAQPLRWEVEDLPTGMKLDVNRGKLYGKSPMRGEFFIKVQVSNSMGVDSARVVLASGGRPERYLHMGWSSSWLPADELNEANLMAIADALVQTGLAAAGYRLLQIDGPWQAKLRNESGQIEADSTRFPRGIAFLSDYLQQRGLSLGLSSNASPHTIHGLPGSLDFEQQDLEQYNKWGVSRLKYDYCCSPPISIVAQSRFGAMGRSIKSMAVPISFDICEWGELQPWQWAKAVEARSWQSTWDVHDRWLAKRYSKKDNGIWNAVQMNLQSLKVAERINCMSDAGLLLLGIKDASLEEHAYSAQLMMWAMMRSPLIMAADPRQLSAKAIEQLCDEELLAIVKEPYGSPLQVKKISQGVELWQRKLRKGYAVYLIINAGTESVEVPVKELIPDQRLMDISLGARRTSLTLPSELAPRQALLLRSY